MKTKKFCLTEAQMPTQWYNIVADMPRKPLPPLHPATGRPVTREDLSALFAEELAAQELSEERFIDIPDKVREIYRIWRPTPLVRATGLEKALDTPAHIYFKNESVSPVGSHKPNTPPYRRPTTTAGRASATLRPRPGPDSGDRPSHSPPDISGSTYGSSWSA